MAKFKNLTEFMEDAEELKNDARQGRGMTAREVMSFVDELKRLLAKTTEQASGNMIITNGKLLYHFYSNSRDMITGETVTEEAMNECAEIMGGEDFQKEYTRMEIREMMTVIKGVELIS